MTAPLRAHMDCRKDECLVGDPSPCALFTADQHAERERLLRNVEEARLALNATRWWHPSRKKAARRFKEALMVGAMWELDNRSHFLSTPSPRPSEDDAIAGEVWQESDGVLLLCVEPGVTWQDFNGHQFPWDAPTVARPLHRLLDNAGKLAPEYRSTHEAQGGHP